MMTLTGCLLLGAIALVGKDATLTIGDNAEISSLKLKSGRELITERVPFAEAFLKDGRRVAAEKAEEVKGKGEGERRIDFFFPDGVGKCSFRVAPFEGGWTFTVAAVDVKDIEKLSFLRVKPNCDRIYGASLCAFMDDEAGVVVRAYDPQLAPPDEHRKKPPVRERGLELLASEKYGMLGRRGGILAVPHAKVREGWKAMTLAAGVSRSKVGGAWALDDEGARGSYIFATWMDMASLDDWISLCEKAGVDILHFHAWWDTWGESDVSTNCFPRGLPDMQLAADRLRAAGIRCGMHTMTLSMQFGSSFLTPECTQELAYRHVYTLARDFRDGDDVLYVNEPIAKDQAKVLTGDSNGNILQLGGELVEYNDFVREKPYRFLGVKRGFMKTNVKKGGYAAGTEAKYPRHRFTAFFPDPDSPLADEVADRLAKVWKACGLCELFFDGSEGPREDYAIDALVAKLYSKLDPGKDGIYCCFSYNRPYNMWFRAYTGAWDYPTTGPKPFTDCHIEHYLRNSRTENLVGFDMGWWQPWRGGATSRGFYDDEMEYYAAKCAGADAAMSLHGFWRTSDHRLPFATESDTTRLGWWERARRARRFRAGLTERFAVPGADWRLKQDADGVWRVRPLAMTKQKVRGTDFAKWTVDSSEERPAELRVAALYAVDDAAARTNALRLVDSSFLKDMVRETAPGVTIDGEAAANGNIRLTASNASAEPTAAWCCLKRKIDDPWLEVNRATTLWVKGDGSGATLNVQIRRTSSIFEGAIAEQYVKLDFTGWRKVGLLLRETDAEYADRFVWPYWDHHTQWSPAHLFRSLPLGRTVGAVSLFLNGIPKGGTVDVEVSPVDSVPEKATTLEKATVVVNGQTTVLPFALKSGEYAELRDGAWTRFASNNEPLQRVATGERLTLRKGDNAVAFYGWSGADEPRAEVTVTGIGAAEDAYTADFDYEAEVLSLYQPSAGFDAPVEAKVHPNGRAKLDLRIDGPIRNPSLTIGGETWTIPVALEESDRVFVRDGKWSATRVVAGANDGERRTKSSQRLPLGEGTLAKPLPVLSSGTTKIAIGADDPETCRARISVVKRYVAAEEHLSTGLAREEFDTYYRKVVGKAPAFPVRIGTLDAMEDVPADVRAKLAAMGPYESSWTAFRDGTLWFVGKEETAELYAVYHFLEEKLGVRWLKAPIEGDDGEYIPGQDGEKTGTWERGGTEAFEVYREPDYVSRMLSATGVYQDRIPEKGMSTAVRNGFSIQPMYTISLTSRDKVKNKRFWDFFRPRVNRRIASAGGGHCLFSEPLAKVFGSRDKAFAAHPEYFAQVDGKRVHRRYPQFCLSNAEFRKLVADYYIRNFDEMGGVGTLYLCAEDVPDGWCECEACLAMDDVDNRGKPLLEVSTRYAKATKEISEAIWAKHPNATIVYMAYSNFRNPPTDVTFDPRMKVQYCIGNRCWGHFLDDPKCDRNVDRLRLFRDWLKAGAEMMTYEYLTCTPNLYSPNEYVEAHDLKFMHDKLRTRSWNNEASFSDSHWIDWGGNTNHVTQMNKFPSNWQWLQVAGHAMWDVNLDVDAFLADRESKYYGAAYPVMKEYHAFRRKLWHANRNHMGYPMDDQRRPTLLLVEGAKEKLLAWLDAAEPLVANDPKRLSRVKLDRFWLDRFWIKPSEVIRERMKNPVVVSNVAKGVKVDGVGDEACWAKACVIDNFLLTSMSSGRKKDWWGKKAPDALKMTAKVMRDDEAFYFLVDLANPEKGYPDYRFTKDRDGSVWGDHEAVEIFLYPPTDENKFYQIAVNAIGTVFDAKHPPCDSKYDLDVAAATKMKPEGGVTMEIRIPVASFCTFKPCENWKMTVVRDLTMRKPILPKGYFQALGGVPHNDTSNYWPVEIK